MIRPSDIFKRRLTAAGVVLFGALCTHPVRAAETAQSSEQTSNSSSEAFARLSEEGSVLYKARDYRKAAEKFIQAYALEQDPNLLFNIARCYDALGDTDAASEKYKEFLAKPGADPQGKQRAEEALRAMSNNKHRDAAPLASNPPPAAAPAAPATPETDVQESNRGSSSGWPWITLATGVAASAAGGAIYILGVSDHNRVTNAPGFGQSGQVAQMTQTEAQSLVDSGRTKKTIGGVTLGVGGALLGTSLILFIVQRKGHGPEQDSVALRASATPQGAGFSLQGRF